MLCGLTPPMIPYPLIGYLYVTCIMGVAYKNLLEVRYFQTSLRRSEFDSEWGAFRTNLNLNKFKEIGFIRLIRCLILNVPNVIIKVRRQHSYRKEDRAKRPIYGCPEKFSESSLRTRLLFQKFVMDFYSDRY